MVLNIAPKHLELAQPHEPPASSPAYALLDGFGTNSISYQLRYDFKLNTDWRTLILDSSTPISSANWRLVIVVGLGLFWNSHAKIQISSLPRRDFVSFISMLAFGCSIVL
jgi:hypothetical protein